MKNSGDKIRLVAVISDTHCGSTVGLMPPDFVTLEGQTIKQNAVQEWLWRCYLDVVSRLKEYANGDPFALVINGDTIEGVHHGTKQIISPDIGDHQNAAVQTLSMIALMAGKIFVVEGTEVHTGSTESKMAVVLNAVPDPNTRKSVWERLALTVSGCRCVFFHHISPTTREYLKGSALSIFLGNEQLAAAKNSEPIPQVVGCGHRHDFDMFSDGTGVCVVGPAFQCKTRHGNKVVPSARIKPGIYCLDWRNKGDGELPHVEKILCQSPREIGIDL